MRYYFDTSSLVKIYHRESGTKDALEIYNNPENQIQISDLGRIEFFSTIHRKYREKEISYQTLEALVSKFQDDTNFRYEILQYSSLVTDEAEKLIFNFASEFSLKTLDSIQLAFFKVYSESDTIFVCSDTKLCNVINKEGYQTFTL